MKPLFFLISFTSTLLMTGIIWIIQLVHYPSFLFVDSNNFLAFHHFHTQIMTFLVGPIMTIELISTFFLALYQIEVKERIIALSALFLIVLIFLSTFFIQVPLHNQLSVAGKNVDLITALISSNWIRTILWTVKSGLLIFLFSRQQIFASKYYNNPTNKINLFLLIEL